MKPPKTEDQLKKHPLVASVSQFKAFPTMPTGFAPAKPRPKWAVELCFGFCFGVKGRHVKKGYDLEIIGRDVHESVNVCRCSRCCEDTPERADSDEVTGRPRVRRAPVRPWVRRNPNRPQCAPHTSSAIPQSIHDHTTITADPMSTADLLSDPCDNDTTSQSDDDSPPTLAVDFETSQGDDVPMIMEGFTAQDMSPGEVRRGEARRAMQAYAEQVRDRVGSSWHAETEG